MASRFVVNRKALERLTRSEQGPGGKLLANKSKKVQAQAKRNLTANKSVDTGVLRNSIDWQFVSTRKELVTRIGTNVDYALYVEEGRGPVVPKNKKVLKFQTKRNARGGRSTVYTQYSKATEGKPYLVPALKAAKK